MSQKEDLCADWHPESIKAEIHKLGLSFRTLSLQAGLAADTLKNALYRPYPKGEKIIAQALGLEPANIWPSRYPTLTRRVA